MELRDQLFLGDTLEVLQRWPEDCVDLAITSPALQQAREKPRMACQRSKIRHTQGRTTRGRVSIAAAFCTE